jgi:Flp pilus assembly pilin Flp
MHELVKNLRQLASDERGSKVQEYALILGLIVVAAAAVITTVGSKALAESGTKTVK